ncbi:MAG: hypothetical protein JXJ17_01830 [Anaerolineae bacterium]|nr:hypothetical protein [Anaerolineae bacterium]
MESKGRTIRLSQSDHSADDHQVGQIGHATIIMPGRTESVEGGRTLRETFDTLGIDIRHDWLVRVGEEEVSDLSQRVLRAGEVVTVVARVVAG